MFYIHWLIAYMDYNYQEHYWYAVKQRQFQNFVISSLMKDVH